MNPNCTPNAAPKRKQGFTLIEMLCAILVLLLVSALMVTGVQLGYRSFRKSVSFSEAQLLCSTLENSISDELRYAGTLKKDADGKVTGFFSQNYGEAAFAGFSSDAKGQILLGGKKLLPVKAYPYGLRASVSIDGYDESARIFHVTLTITDSSGSNTLASEKFDVHQLNEPDETGG